MAICCSNEEQNDTLHCILGSCNNVDCDNTWAHIIEPGKPFQFVDKIYLKYRIVGNFGGTKFCRMTRKCILAN